MTAAGTGAETTMPAPSENQVRIETSFYGEHAVHDVNTRFFLDNIKVKRRGDHVELTMGPVKITMRRRVASDVRDAIHALDKDSKVDVAEPSPKDHSNHEHAGLRERNGG